MSIIKLRTKGNFLSSQENETAFFCPQNKGVIQKQSVFRPTQEKKNAFCLFFFSNLVEFFGIYTHIQGTTMWKLTSWGFRKGGTFWACNLSNGSCCCSKSIDFEIFALSPNISGVKKRHGHNFDFWGLKRIGRLINYVIKQCYSFQVSKIKIVAVSFFNTAFQTIFFWFLTRFRQPITPL